MKIINNVQATIEIGSINNKKNIFTPKYFWLYK